jgi:hypothetical protein
MDSFISARYRTTCYHCHEDADQIITAVPNVAEVVCEHCGATRAFIPVIEDVTNKGDYVKPGCYDIWKLDIKAACRNCGVYGSHDTSIGCRNFTVRCRNCGFTHLYRFNLEYSGGTPEK